MATVGIEYSDRELPVPSVWRPVFREIVQAFVEGDFTLSRGIAGVKPPSRANAEFFAHSVEAYGATLACLSDESWQTSIYVRDGDYWQVLVDLITVEEGRSDLVLFTRVYERGDGYAFEPWSLHVP
jgi:hypothetical protein